MYDLIYTREREDSQKREHPDFTYIYPVKTFLGSILVGMIAKAMREAFKDEEYKDWISSTDWNDPFSEFRFERPARVVAGRMQAELKELQERPSGHNVGSVTHAVITNGQVEIKALED